jgi:hypothetical protein
MTDSAPASAPKRAAFVVMRREVLCNFDMFPLPRDPAPLRAGMMQGERTAGITKLRRKLVVFEPGNRAATAYRRRSTL